MLRCHTCALPLLVHTLPTPPSPAPTSATRHSPPPPRHAARCPACTQHPPPLAQCVAAVEYDFPWHTLIQRFKFQGEVAWARWFAQLMWQAPSVPELMSRCDWWLPLPLSAHRLGERGYNQSWELLKHLARLDAHGQKPAPHHSDWLLKLGDTADQHALGRAERLLNLSSAFSVAPQALPHLAHRHVLLVDDVMTTGATLHAAALALRRAGASAVSALVLARTPDTAQAP